MSYASYEDLIVTYSTLEEIPSFTFQERPWFDNPVPYEPLQVDRHVSFKEPITDTLVFDKNEPPSAATFAFQIACDTIRPAANNTSIPLVR